MEALSGTHWCAVRETEASEAHLQSTGNRVEIRMGSSHLQPRAIPSALTRGTCLWGVEHGWGGGHRGQDLQCWPCCP